MIKKNKPLLTLTLLAFVSAAIFLGVQFENLHKINKPLPEWVLKAPRHEKPEAVATASSSRIELKPISQSTDSTGQVYFRYKGFCSGVNIDVPRELLAVNDSYSLSSSYDAEKYSTFTADGKSIENGRTANGFRLSSSILPGSNDPYLDIPLPKKTKIVIAGRDAYSVDTSALESGTENILLYRIVGGKNMRYSFFFHNISQHLRDHIIASFEPIGLPDSSKCN